MITRHISTKKLPTLESLRSARIIAVRAHKPIAAETKNITIQKKIWLKLEKCTSPE